MFCLHICGKPQQNKFLIYIVQLYRNVPSWTTNSDVSTSCNALRQLPLLLTVLCLFRSDIPFLVFAHGSAATPIAYTLWAKWLCCPADMSQSFDTVINLFVWRNNANSLLTWRFNLLCSESSSIRPAHGTARNPFILHSSFIYSSIYLFIHSIKARLKHFS